MHSGGVSMNQSANITKYTQRNYGIDLLRLVAGFYVVLLHSFTLGGLYAATKPLSYQEITGRIVLIVTFCCVNIFGIVSGYVGYREPLKKHNYYGYFPVWLTVVFYCIINTGIYMIFFPGPAIRQFLRISLLPLTSDLYWYFSGYTFVYFLAPYLNKMLYYSSDKELKQLFFIILAVFITVEYVGGSFEFGGGYASVWLLLLYLLGGILKKTEIGSIIPSYLLVLALIATNALYFYIGSKWTTITVLSFTLDFSVSGYLTSPFLVATAILHVMLFSRFRFPAFAQKVIRFAAPASFSVYILNTYPPFWDLFIKGRFRAWATSSPIGILARTICAALAFVCAVVIVDYFRQKLFNLLGVQNWPKKFFGLFHKSSAA